MSLSGIRALAPWPALSELRATAKAEWNRKEAERELDCYLADRPYTYCPPKEEWFHPGAGYIMPPKGGSSVQAEKR